MKITNRLQKSGTRSIKGILSLLFLFSVLQVSAANKFEGQKFAVDGAEKSSIQFNSDHTFNYSDSILTSAKSGTWERTKDLLILNSKRDSTVISDTLEITYETKHRLSVKKGALFYSLNTGKTESHNWLVSIGRGDRKSVV